MKTLISFIVSALFLIATAHGAVREQISRPSDGSLSGHKLTLDNLGKLANLGSRTSFRATHGDGYPTAKGGQRLRLTQTYAGLDVHGASAQVELGIDGQLTGQLSGHVYTQLEKDIPDPLACEREVSDVMDMAIGAEGLETTDSHIDRRDGLRLVYVDPETSQGHIAYRVEFFYARENFFSLPVYYIDACSLKVLATFNQIQNASLPSLRREELTGQNQTDTLTDQTSTPTPRELTACPVKANGVGGNKKTGQQKYNTPPFCLNVHKKGNKCFMENTYARVIDNEQKTSMTKDKVVSFTCIKGYKDPINGAYGVANDAMYYGDVTGRLYVEKYNVRALPYAPRLVVHFSRCLDNAFWNGVDMFFGDGCRDFYPLVSQDVVTHELGHGITTRNSNLEYRGQSGGINEAFSYISGEVAEVFGRSSNDWMVGQELLKAKGALRYFINPEDDGRSIKHVKDYRDRMNVHYSSGIFNHAFYQLVEVQGMPIYEAYSCFLEANLVIWSSTTDFQEGACGVKQACFDNGLDTKKVDAAFSVVGIDLSTCKVDPLDTVVPLGSSRSDILVSTRRHPILKMDIGDAESVVIATKAQDKSSVQIQVSMDMEGKDVLTSGPDSVTVTDADAFFVYVTLSSDASDDVKVTLTVT